MKQFIFIIFIYILVGIVTFASHVHAQVSGSLLDTTSIKIDGEDWTFHTPPPPKSQRKVLSSHPRLFLTQANLPNIRNKLADPVYASDMIALNTLADSGSAVANAFLYQLNGDVARGTVAKNWLLAGVYGDVQGLLRSGDFVNPVIVFDWVMPLLSNTEKIQAFNLVRDNFDYDHRTATKDKPGWYMNDIWAHHPRLHYSILALAIVGDGIDNIWAQEVLDIAYDGENTIVRGPYGATRGGGFLDVLATISLDSGGGSQTAGTPGTLGTNYYGMFMHSFLPIGAWETATGEKMWDRVTFFSKIPSHWVYDKKRVISGLGPAVLEFITGVYKETDPDEAALAKYLLDKSGRSKYNLIYRLVLGDLRVSAKSPTDLNMPTSKYVRGADLFTSSHSWADDALTLSVYSRYLDTNRYEPGSGIFAIHRGLEPLAVPGESLKTKPSAGYYSAMWIYDPAAPTVFTQGSTYWAGLNNYPQKPHRAKEGGLEPVTDPNFFPGGPDKLEINNNFRAISMEYGKLFKTPGVRKTRRTIVHIPDGTKDFIVIYDYTDVPSTLKQAWSMRLATAPTIQGNSYSIPGMHTSIITPSDGTISWIGGLGDELRTPPPEKLWYNSSRLDPGYSIDQGLAKRVGIGNLFVQPTDTSEQKEYLAVIEVTSTTKTGIIRVSDREVRFDNWQVSFSSSGDYKVTSGDGSIDDVSPSPPTRITVQ